MSSAIFSYFNQFKLYIYIALLGLLAFGVLFYGHSRYDAGIASCTQEYANANAEYNKRKEQQNQRERETIAKEASDAADKIVGIEHKKENILQQLDAACGLSDVERLRLNEAINSVQGR